MIVTRRRRRRLNLGRFALPLLALAALAVALVWPPSHDAIANGPLKPVWTVAGRFLGTISAPLHFAAQQQQITERNQQIRDLNARLEQQRAVAAADDGKVQQLQQQISALASQPRPTPQPSVRPTQAAAVGVLGAQAGGQTASSSDGDRRLAATWAAMEPEKAAAIVQRLPDDQAVRILALMDADSAGQIMNALPANVAARLSRVSPQVGTTTNR